MWDSCLGPIRRNCRIISAGGPSVPSVTCRHSASLMTSTAAQGVYNTASKSLSFLCRIKDASDTECTSQKCYLCRVLKKLCCFVWPDIVRVHFLCSWSKYWSLNNNREQSFIAMLVLFQEHHHDFTHFTQSLCGLSHSFMFIPVLNYNILAVITQITEGYTLGLHDRRKICNVW